MIFQRQDCVLSNNYKELSITQTSSLYILFGSWDVIPALSAKAGSYHVISAGPFRQDRVGHVIVRDTLVQGGTIGPRMVRWYKAAWLPGLDRKNRFGVLV